MMGRTHALSGALAMLAAAPAVHAIAPGLAPAGPVELAAATVACAGAALLPDLDHPSSTVARSLGWPTVLLARAVAWAARGHRQATHSVPFVLLAAGLLGAAGDAGGWWAWVPVVLLVGLAADGVGISSTPAAVVVTAVVVGVGAWAGVEFGAWLGLAAGVGTAAHIAGDCLTVQGCPLWWPRPRRYRAAELRTGGRGEKWVAVVLVVGIAGAVLLHGPGLPVGGRAATTEGTGR